MIVGKIKGRVQIKDVFFDLDQPLTMEDLRMSDSLEFRVNIDHTKRAASNNQQ